MGQHSVLMCSAVMVAASPLTAFAGAPDPVAKKMSLAKGAAYLDRVSMSWLRQNQCAACHTSYPHLMAGSAMKTRSADVGRMRKFLENRVASWDSGKPEDRPVEGTEGITEVVATATTLAFDDSHTTGKLHPLTRKALDRMWTLQMENGAWNWNKHLLPPTEYDDWFGAVYAALGTGLAPEGYARGEAARKGLEKLRGYFQKNPAPNLHHKAWLLWASLKVDGLMSKDDRAATIKSLFALQRPDGGWNLPSLGDWKRLDGTPNDKYAPSDSYATGLITYVLRQARIPAKDPRIQESIAWMKANQRESGKWFTRSLNADRAHYIANAGTAFCLMALHSCGASD